MNKKIKPMLIILVLFVVLAVAMILINIIEKYMPTKEKADINQVFGIEENVDESVIAVIVDNKVIEEDSIREDESIYINLTTVKENINSKFYWDNNENILIFTTPNDVIKADVGSKDYYNNKVKNSLDYTIVKTDGENVYIAAEFVKLFTGIKYKYYTDPGRVTITNTWGTYEVSEVSDNSEIRVSDNIKSPIIISVKKGDTLTIIKKDDKWSKVNLEGGYIGYIKNKDLGKFKSTEKTNNFTKPVYTSISRDYKINLVWHQVFNQTANNYLVDLTANAKGINVVSPTWFTLADDQGNINSLVDNTYINRAHQLGYEVWALLADFSDDDTSGEFVASVLSSSSKRENLINKVISTAIEYNLDGLNIDFEYIKKENGEDFIQFLRELSIKCRNNNIVLSVDNYVPSAWTEFYNKAEQGELVDYVIIMAYDEYTNSTGESGPVASIKFVKDAISNILLEVSASKVVIGIPFYTRVWQETPEEFSEQGSTIIEDSINGNYSINSKNYGMSAINDIIKNKSLTKTWLSDFGLNYCEYEDANSIYRMWVEDEQSIEEKMKLINENDLAGVASWKLGLEVPDIWNIIIKYVN